MCFTSLSVYLVEYVSKRSRNVIAELAGAYVCYEISTAHLFSKEAAATSTSTSNVTVVSTHDAFVFTSKGFYHRLWGTGLAAVGSLGTWIPSVFLCLLHPWDVASMLKVASCSPCTHSLNCG